MHQYKLWSTEWMCRYVPPVFVDVATCLFTSSLLFCNYLHAKMNVIGLDYCQEKSQNVFGVAYKVINILPLLTKVTERKLS